MKTQRNKRLSTWPSSGEGVVHLASPDEQSTPSLGRPSQGLLQWPPGLAGAWTGWASCLSRLPGGRLLRGQPQEGAHGDEQAGGLQPE